MRHCTFWIGHTDTDINALREIKVGIVRALVIGMGLKWPEGEREVEDDEFLIYGIRVSTNRITEFCNKITSLGPELSLADLGTVDCPDEDSSMLVPRCLEVNIQS